jgi:uncharacterized protein YbjQ (UPF0145 family)
MSNIFSTHFVPLNSSAIFTTPDVPGRRVEESFGLVAILVQGGVGPTESNASALFSAMVDKARELGGNAIVCARFEAVLGTQMLYGTAVRLSS